MGYVLDGESDRLFHNPHIRWPCARIYILLHWGDGNKSVYSLLHDGNHEWRRHVAEKSLLRHLEEFAL